MGLRRLRGEFEPMAVLAFIVRSARRFLPQSTTSGKAHLLPHNSKAPAQNALVVS